MFNLHDARAQPAVPAFIDIFLRFPPATGVLILIHALSIIPSAGTVRVPYLSSQKQTQNTIESDPFSVRVATGVCLHFALRLGNAAVHAGVMCPVTPQIPFRHSLGCAEVLLAFADLWR